MRLVVGPLALLLVALLPPGQAGTSADPDVVDPAGDVLWEDMVPPPHPCVEAVDLLSLWVEWTDGGALFHYTFSDLSAVGEQPSQDFTGRCFYSYADFVLTRADGTELVESLYVDHWANPIYETGWRFYLHGSRAEAVGTVDAAAGTIDVLVPSAALGDPGPGDVLGMFRVQSTTQMASTPLASDYATDFSPDGEPCACPVPFPASAPSPGAGGNDTAAPAATASSSQSSSRSATSAPASVRPPAAGPDAGPSSSDAPASAVDDEADKESPLAPWVALLALLGVALARRRMP